MVGQVGKTTVRDATLQLLRAFDMTTIFGNPGSTELPMFRDFPQDFRYVLGLQESIVLGMADGYAQATRKAAFVNLHSAAGVGHALGNLFTAYKNQTPLVVTAGQQARSILPYQPYLFAEQAAEFPKPYVKWSIEPARAEDVPAAIAQAYYLAMQPPRGPVFVSVPVDDWDRDCAMLPPRRVSTQLAGDPALLAELAEALAQATRPILVVGSGVARDHAWNEVIALAERHEMRVWIAYGSGRNAFPENHRLFAGFLPPSREAMVRTMAGADLILMLGGALSVYHLEGFGPHAPDGAQVYQISDNPAAASCAPVGTAIVTHVKLAVQRLLAGPMPRHRPQPSKLPRPPVLSGAPMTDAYLMQQIARLRPPNAIIVEEAPSSRAPMHDYLPIVAPDSFYAGASGGLGHGLPAAIGIALARPDQKVVAILGDGSAMYAIQGLWTAAQLGLPISFVIVNNRRYEALVQFGRLFGLHQTVGTKLPALDFCALATGQGVPACRVGAATELDRALTNALTAAGPTLVEVVVDQAPEATTP